MMVILVSAEDPATDLPHARHPVCAPRDQTDLLVSDSWHTWHKQEEERHECMHIVSR